MRSTEQRLEECLKNGDLKALEKIMRYYTGYVCAVARNFSGGILSEDDIDELAIDIFYKLWEHRQNLLVENGLRAYLAAMTRNAVKNKLRILPPENDNIDDMELSDSVSIEERAEFNETLSALYEALATLNEDEREIFEQFTFMGLKSSQISKLVNIPANTVRSKLKRTREKLKKILADKGFN